jgi:hypothetical protein
MSHPGPDPHALLPELPEDVREGLRLVLSGLPAVRRPAVYAARHALRNLRYAWRVKDLDPLVAIFRAIHAEEEAASALIRSVQRIGYRGADELVATSHTHKAGVWPMLIAVMNSFSKHPAPWFGAEVLLRGIGEDARTSLRLKFPRDGMPPLYAESELPLNLNVHVNDEVQHFEDELRALASESNKETIAAHIRKRGQVRNDLLYATEDGFPDANGDVGDELRRYAFSTRGVLLALLLVDPHDVQQTFAQQVVDAYLKVIRKRRAADGTR